MGGIVTLRGFGGLPRGEGIIVYHPALLGGSGGEGVS